MTLSRLYTCLFYECSSCTNPACWLPESNKRYAMYLERPAVAPGSLLVHAGQPDRPATAAQPPAGENVHQVVAVRPSRLRQRARQPADALPRSEASPSRDDELPVGRQRLHTADTTQGFMGAILLVDRSISHKRGRLYATPA